MFTKNINASSPSLHGQKEPVKITPLSRKEIDEAMYAKMSTSGRSKNYSTERNREGVTGTPVEKPKLTFPSMPKSGTPMSTSSNQKAYTEPNGGYEALMTPRRDLVAKEKPISSSEKKDKDNLDERLFQKITENEKLRLEIYRLENELRICQKNLKTAFNNEDAFSTSQLTDKELKEILEALKLYLSKSEEAYEDLMKKCNKLDELINFMDSGHLTLFKGVDVKEISDRLKHVLQECKTTSQLELEIGVRSRDLVKKKLELAHLNSKHNKLSIRCEALQRDLDALRESLKAGHVEKNIFVKSLTKEKSLNRETQKKLGNLQQTLELLIDGPKLKSLHTEEDFNIEVLSKHNSQMPSEYQHFTPPKTQAQKTEEKEYSTTKLRDALSKLVKDNESLRRVIHLKNKEIEKLNDNLAKTTWKLNKATLRIEKLRNIKGGGIKMNDGTQDEEDLLVSYTNNNSMTSRLATTGFLDNSKGLPKNLDFRFAFFDEKYVDLVNDVLEGGSQAFAEHVRMLTSDEEIREEITLISNQFISYRNFAEKMNRMMSECLQLFSMKSINKVMVHIASTMKQILGARVVRMWVHEQTIGTLRTMESSDKELKCLITKGLVSEVLKTSSRIISKIILQESLT